MWLPWRYFAFHWLAVCYLTVFALIVLVFTLPWERLFRSIRRRRHRRR